MSEDIEILNLNGNLLTGIFELRKARDQTIIEQI